MYTDTNKYPVRRSRRGHMLSVRRTDSLSVSRVSAPGTRCGPLSYDISPLRPNNTDRRRTRKGAAMSPGSVSDSTLSSATQQDGTRWLHLIIQLRKRQMTAHSAQLTTGRDEMASSGHSAQETSDDSLLSSATQQDGTRWLDLIVYLRKRQMTANNSAQPHNRTE